MMPLSQKFQFKKMASKKCQFQDFIFEVSHLGKNLWIKPNVPSLPLMDLNQSKKCHTLEPQTLATVLKALAAFLVHGQNLRGS